MTGNQIAFWNLQETKRSNLVNEGIKDDTLAETKRSNLINEGIKSDTLRETQRSNLINEGLKDRDIAAKERDIESQIKRRDVQNVTDSVKTATGGFKDIASGLFGKGGITGALFG